MHYEICVSLNGKHFFATADRSITSQIELQKVLPVIMAKFPESEGYKVEVSYWENAGYTFGPKQIAKVLKGESVVMKQ